MKQLQRIFKVLGNPRRLAVAQLLLKRRELSVGTIAKAMELSYTATSKHLGAMANVDVVEKRQEGLTVYYRISENTSPLLRSVFQLIRQNP